MLVGAGKLIDPSRLAHVFVSPRKRAIKTFELLMQSPPSTTAECEVTFTEDIAEWDYGNFEGLMEWEIRSLIKTKGLVQGREWNIWRDGCEGGEYVCAQLHAFPDHPNKSNEPLLKLSLSSNLDQCSKLPSVWTDSYHKSD